MNDKSRLVYTNRCADLVRMARERGLSIEEIVKILTHGCYYDERKEIAKKFHDFLGITYGEFMRIAGGMKIQK